MAPLPRCVMTVDVFWKVLFLHFCLSTPFHPHALPSPFFGPRQEDNNNNDPENANMYIRMSTASILANQRTSLCRHHTPLSRAGRWK